MSDENFDKYDQDLESASLKYLSLAFISLIFVIIILAVGTQLVFSPEKVTSWVKSSLNETGLRDKLKEAKIKIAFKKAQITLTGSLLYPIGVRLNGIKMSADRGCKQYSTAFNSVVVPFGIVEILKGDFKLGTVKLSQGFTEETDVCKTKTRSSSKASGAIVGEHYLEKRLLDFDKMFRELFQSLQNEGASINKVQGFLIYDWSYTESTTVKLKVDRFKVYSLTGDFILKGDWSGSIGFKSENLDFDGEVMISEEHISLSSELKYKEGEALLNYFYERGSNSSFQASVDNMPMSVFVSFFSFEQKFSTSFLRSSWLSLKLKLDLLQNEIKSELNSFDIKTEDGAIDLVSGKAQGKWSRVNRKWAFKKPIKFIFTNFKALNLLNLDVQKDLSKLFIDFGKFDLSLVVDENLNVEGVFESSEQGLFIRSGGRLGVQKIISFLGKFNWGLEKDFRLRIYQVRLEEGEFEGEIIYTLNNQTTKLTADIRELSLNPDLWKEVFQVEFVGGLSITGEADIERKKKLGLREIASQFKVSLSQIEHKFWSLENAVFDCAFSELLSCNLKFSKLYPKSKLKKWLEEERPELIEDLGNFGEMTLKDKVLELRFFYKNSYTRRLSLNWSADQGPILVFPNGSELNLRSL